MVIPIFSVGLVVGGGVMANNKMPKIRIILYTHFIQDSQDQEEKITDYFSLFIVFPLLLVLYKKKKILFCVEYQIKMHQHKLSM